MTNNESKEPGDGQGAPRKPRGMGGVILILALVMALFLILSSSSGGGQSSIHAFRSHLLNGRLSNFTLDAQGTVSAPLLPAVWRRSATHAWPRMQTFPALTSMS